MNFPFASLTLGVLDFLINSLIGIITSAINVILELIMSLFADLFYAIGMELLWLADFAQGLFRRLAGLEPYWYAGDAATSDPLLLLFSEQNILEVFIALGIVAVAMLIMATVVQIIRVQYTQEGAKNTIGNIVGQSLKALAMFIIVPIGAFLGIFISNQLLAAVDGATNVSGSQTVGGAIFTAAAADANRVRLKSENVDNGVFAGLLSGGTKISINNHGEINTEANNNGAFVYVGTDASERMYIVSQLVDNAFAQNQVNNNVSGDFDAAHLGPTFSYDNLEIVKAYYDIGDINYLVLYVAAGLSIWSLYMAVFGLMMRLYKAVILFVIAPPVVALMPLEGGNAFKQWRTSFLGAVIGAYGVVVTLNMFFILLPLLKNIQLFDPGDFNNYYFNNFTYLLMVIVGCYMFKDLSSMISSIFGGEDVLGSGSAMAGKATSMATKVAMGAATGGMGLIGAAADGASAVGSAISGASNSRVARKALAAGDVDKAKRFSALADMDKKNAKASFGNVGKDLSTFTGLAQTGMNKITGAAGLGSNVAGRTKKMAVSKYNQVKGQFEENAYREELRTGIKRPEKTVKPTLNQQITAKDQELKATNNAMGMLTDTEKSSLLTTINNQQSAFATAGSNFESNISKASFEELANAIEAIGTNERGNDLLEKINSNIAKLENAGSIKEKNAIRSEISKDYTQLNGVMQQQTNDKINYVSNPSARVNVNIANKIGDDISSMDAKLGNDFKEVIKTEVDQMKNELKQAEKEKKDAAALQQKYVDQVAKAVEGKMDSKFKKLEETVKKSGKKK